MTTKTNVTKNLLSTYNLLLLMESAEEEDREQDKREIPHIKPGQVAMLKELALLGCLNEFIAISRGFAPFVIPLIQSNRPFNVG